MKAKQRSFSDLEQIVANASDCLWEVDRDGIYTYCSPQIETILGYSPDEVVGLSPFDFMATGEADKVREEYSLIVEKQEPFHFLRNYNLHKNGKLVLLETSGNPFFDEAGNFAGYRGVGRDITSRKDLENENFIYETLLDSISEATFITDSDGIIIHVNKHFTDLFGYSFEEIVGQNPSVLNPLDVNRADSVENSLSLLAEGKDINSIRVRRKKNGELVTVKNRARPIKDINGQTIQMVCSYDDLTDVLKFESDFARNSKLLEQSQRLAKVGGWELDITSGELYWTAETYHIHETTPEEFNPTVDASVSYYLPESRKIISEALDKAINQGQGYDLILDTLTTRGNQITVRTTAEVTFEEGRPVKLTGIFQDISTHVEEQKKLGEALQENQLAVKTAQLGIWTFDLAQQKLHWSDVQFSIFGLSRDEFDGSLDCFEKRLHPEDKDEVMETLGQVLQGVELFDVNFRIILPDNEVRHISGSVSPVFDKDDNVIKAIGINRDITNRVIAENTIAEYLEKLQTTLNGTIELAMNLNSLRDPYTSGHEMRVSMIAREIGIAMGLDEFVVQGLTEGGKLHDIGKFVVPVEILSKPGDLSDFEYQLIQTHSQEGYKVLSQVEFPWPVAQMALQHHERLDGSGYPQGLKGDEIILEARILAVADVVEAMTSHRPFRPSLGIDTALNEIEKGRGKLYDEKVVDACLKLFREQGFTISEASI